ncbi:MAG: hypothetical protein U0Z44_21005 [Kouleothrix sp.]
MVNFTDVDDKIINRANELGRNPKELARSYVAEFLGDLQALNIPPATATARHRAVADHPLHRQPDRAPPPTRPAATCTSACHPTPTTASFRAQPERHARRHAESMSASYTRPISRCGRPPSPASHSGPAPGATAGQAGISSARP